MTYTRINPQTGVREFSQCLSIRLSDGRAKCFPTAEEIAALGWEEWTPPVIPPQPQTEPSEWEKVEALNALLATDIVALDDESAAVVKALFTPWIEYVRKQESKSDTDPDVIILAGTRVYFDDDLYKCIKAHTPQRTWTPKDAHSLFTKISIEDGSKEHPIRFSQGLEIFSGKYYTQYDVKYKCIRDSLQGLWADLKDVVANYVEVVTE